MGDRQTRHKWAFQSRFRRHAFGWRSQPAIERVKQAVAEIKGVARQDPVLGAEGAVLLLERLSPALEHVEADVRARIAGLVEGASPGAGWAAAIVARELARG